MCVPDSEKEVEGINFAYMTQRCIHCYIPISNRATTKHLTGIAIATYMYLVCIAPPEIATKIPAV